MISIAALERGVLSFAMVFHVRFGEFLLRLLFKIYGWNKTRDIFVLERYQSKLSSITSLVIAFLMVGCFVAQAGTDDFKGDSSHGGGGEFIITNDPIGKLGTTSTNGFNGGSTNGFFAPLGTNGRTCATCHIADDAYTLSPASAKKIARKNFRDPLFAPVDGSDCPPVS